MKNLLFAFVAALILNTSLQAETLVYQATKDFPDTSSGEVPYYVHNSRSALAINASIEAFRDKFARATASYNGSGGLYDVTVSALGEIDGECEFRFLVNGVVVASAVNVRVSDDYGVQNHVFKDIYIPENAEIAVESNAVSNGLVPENDIFAFARGRWTTLTLETDETAVAPTVDLALSTDIDDYSPAVGQSITLSFNIFNENPTQTATNPELQITLPSGLTFNQPSQCSVSGTTVSCPLEEIGPKQDSTFTITATATQSGTVPISATISADQQDSQPSNNTNSTELDISAQVITAAPTVNLAVTATSDVSSAKVGDTVNYSLTVVNQHQTNVATSPVVGVLLPGGMSFSASSDCSANGRSITCNLQELTANQSTTVNFSSVVNVAGTATLIVSVSAAETEDAIDDNEVLVSVNVEDEPSTTIDPNRGLSPQTPVDNTSATGGNGGGSFGAVTLLILGHILGLVTVRNRRRRRLV